MKPITESYIKHKGWRCTNMNDENVLMPFFLADSAYLIFSDQIKPLALRQDLKMYAKRFIRAYNSFAKDFFSPFDQEQKDYIIDKMDTLFELISGDIEAFRSAIIDHTSQFSEDVRHTLASLSALLSLTQCTWIVYRHLYVASGAPMYNKDLQSMMTSAHSLFQAYANKKANRINVPELNKVQAISAASRALCDRILQFINLTKEQNELQANEDGCGCTV